MRRAQPTLLSFALAAVLLALAAGCGPAYPVVNQPTHGPGGSRVTQAPLPSAEVRRAQAAAQAFLDAWSAKDYPAMYAHLTQLSQDAISAEDFAARYTDAAAGLTLLEVQPTILGVLPGTMGTVQVSYRAVYHSALLDELQSQMTMNLSLENGAWRIQWEDGLIHDQLRGGNHFKLEVSAPSRGNIYDRDGHALAAYADAVALGVVPGQIDPLQEETMLAVLSRLTGKSSEQIRLLYADQNPDWYIPVGEASAEAVQEAYAELNGLAPAVQMSPYRARYYEEGTVAPHVVGNLQPIPEAEAEDYRALGYLADEKVGRAGLEAWGEAYLRGRPRASLYVVSPQGQTVTRLAHVEALAGESITTTLDKELQSKIQKSLNGYRGAVVVLERDTGRVLAMVSSPTYDANLFEPTNTNSSQLNQVLNDDATPLLNRATLGVYPLGSVFKIISMAAGLESGLFTPQSTYECGYVFDELDYPFYDWTYEHGVAPSGLLNLPGGLIRSCNPWFWHIGLSLYEDPDHQDDLWQMARAFGLGQKTGVELPEAAGLVPEPETPYEAIGLAIGQDRLQVTPLQVARFIAAVGNGGTLYRPQLVEQIARLEGTPSLAFKPDPEGTLPVSPEDLAVIQDAMYGVVNSTEPLGTAHFVLANLNVPTAGKTGTAQTENEPHAWFAGYTFDSDTGKPDIAIAVVLENAGEGSVMAAPVFRRVVQLYYSNNQDPGALLPWETSYYESAPTETPTTDGAAPPDPDATPEP